MPTHHLRPTSGQNQPEEQDICFFAQTNYRNQMRQFGIKLDDRRRHMYVIGKTGMGKTTVMENMVLHDIYAGHGVGVVDPHGDFAEKIINFVPANRINDVVYFNPCDLDFPIGFNILEVENDEQKHLVASGLMGIFKKIWPDVWSARMEYILNNTILALLDYPGSTLLGINRLLSDKKYRRKVIRQVKDPVIKAFWQTEFASYNDRYAQEAVAPIQNKIGQFLSASVIRNMVAQVKSTIDVRQLMDNRKIIIMNLSKGRIGEDNSRLLGGMLITKIQLAAMERVDTPEKDRKDFFLYVDEFQNFASPSFANILSEARKYRLSLIMAHQYITQLDEVVANAVFGNVGTILTFRVGGQDAEFLVKEFTPTFLEEDIVNLPKFQIFLKLMIDGVASHPFSAMTMPPIGTPTGNSEKIIRVSRERYAKPRDLIEEKIMKWSGMSEGEEDDEEDDEPEEEGELRKPLTFQPKKPFVPKPPSFKTSAPSYPPTTRPVSSAATLAPAPKPAAQPVAAPAPKPAVVAPAPSVEKPAVPQEPAVSLRSLPPRDTTVRREPAPAPVVQVNTAPKVTVEPFFASTTSPVSASVSADGERKKRKRRRKKKSAGGVLGVLPGPGMQSQQSSAQPPSRDTQPTHDTQLEPQPQPERAPEPPQQPLRPTVLAPDQVIRFDDVE